MHMHIHPPPICAHTHHAYTYSSCIHSNSLPFCIPYLLSQIYYNTTDKHMSTSTLCVHTDTASSQLHSMTACSMKKKCKSQSKNGKTPHAGHKQIKYKSIMRTAWKNEMIAYACHEKVRMQINTFFYQNNKLLQRPHPHCCVTTNRNNFQKQNRRIMAWRK